MKKLEKGACVVLTNGVIAEVELEDPRWFVDREAALAYIQEQQESYPTLDFYLCPVTELHHTTTICYVRRL